MSDLTISTTDEQLSAVFDEALYPRDAVYGAAYVFIDRCFVHLDRPADGKISVTLRLKPGSTAVLGELAGELGNELLAQAWRREIAEDGRAVVELIATRALAGAAGPPGLDDLLDLEDGGGAFEDPLGIAMSWEEKYKKKKPEGEGAEGEAGEGAPKGEAADEPKKDAP
jgi:His-Xaa-Ser system protein HxsD